MESIREQESQSRLPVYLHYCPKEVEEHPITTCGLNIDQPKALAWTRSRDLESYQHMPMDRWPKPCPICQQSATRFT